MKRQRSGCAVSGCLLVAGLMGVGIVVCGGIAVVGFRMAKEELAQADAMFDRGDRDRAVEIYTQHFMAVSASDRSRIAERVLKHKLDGGDREGAEVFAEKVASLQVTMPSTDRRLKDVLEVGQKRYQESLQRMAASSGGGNVSVGETGVLRMPGRDTVLVAADQTSHDRIMTLSVANDDTGIAQLVLSGRAYLVPAGTKARVIRHSGFGVREVRIIEGEHRGESAFVNSDFLFAN